MERLFDLISVLGIVLIAIVLRSLRREHIRVEHSVSWLLAGFTLLLLSRSQRFLQWITDALGLGNAVVPVLLLVLVVFAAVIYRLSRVVSELKDMNITLTQRLAMLEFELRTRNEATKQIEQKEPGTGRTR
jgi:hypothetical protein